MSISQVGCLVGTVDIPTVNLAFAQGPISAGSSTRLDWSLAQPCCSSNRSVELSSRRLKCKRRVGRSVHRPIKWLVANPTQSPRANFPYLELARSSHRLLCITRVTPRACVVGLSADKTSCRNPGGFPHRYGHDPICRLRKSSCFLRLNVTRGR